MGVEVGGKKRAAPGVGRLRASVDSSAGRCGGRRDSTRRAGATGGGPEIRFEINSLEISLEHPQGQRDFMTGRTFLRSAPTVRLPRSASPADPATANSAASLPSKGARRASDFGRWAVALAFGALALLLPGCDNPACVFGGTCNPDNAPGGGGSGSTTPANHAWLRDGAPTVTNAYPTGVGASLQSPLMLVFSESMAASSFSQALELVADGAPAGIPVAISSLIGDGRVWVGAPTVPLTESTEYDLRVVAERALTDLQGVNLALGEDRVLASFTTAAATPTTPRVLGTFPADGTTQQSATSEIVVVFDRPMNPLSFSTSSFAVTVNGAPPANNQAPQALSTLGGAPDTRVWRYRTVDAQGEVVPFPNSADVVVELSPTTAPLAPAAGGNALPRTLVDYTTAALAAPLSAHITSTPDDAIGSSNLDGTSPLSIALDLNGAQIGDTLRIYIFGRTRTEEPESVLLARSVDLTTTTLDVLLQVATVGEAHIDLASSTSPVSVRIAEETFHIAFALQRGSYQTPVRLLDVDADQSGVQGPVLDVTAPTFEGLGASGTSISAFVTDQRDIVVTGRASEEIRACEVSITGGGDNGLVPETVASNADGLFVARPVTAGLVDPATQPLDARVWLYDRALNRSISSAQPAVRQVGAIGPGAVIPGAAQVQVEVRDARTLAPLSGARVVTHEDLGAGPVLVAFGTTDGNGRIDLNVGAAGEALVTVDLAGYNLWTFHGVTRARVSVLLDSLTASTAPSGGTLSSSLSALSSLEALVADSRVSDGASATLDIPNCSAAGTVINCPFGPVAIRAGALGALSGFAVDTPPTAFNFSASTFLRGFAPVLPLPAGSTSAPSTATPTITRFLDDPAVDLEERALAGPDATLDATALTGLALAQLSGSPRVSIQGLVPGIGASWVVGLGAALDPIGTPASLWELRSAIPGAADPTDGKYVGDEFGELFVRGTLEGELYLRVELRDTLGARSVARTPLAGVGPVVLPPDAPTVLAPTIGSTTAGSSYEVTFSDTLPGGGDPGLYRVTLVGSNGRRWFLWRADSSGASRTVWAPPIDGAGGVPLPPGAVAASVRAYAYPTFDAAEFLFSDLERFAQTLADSAAVVFNQP
jgi:hypothetical protein